MTSKQKICGQYVYTLICYDSIVEDGELFYSAVHILKTCAQYQQTAVSCVLILFIGVRSPLIREIKLYLHFYISA